MKYLPVKEISRADAEEALGSADVEKISFALVSISSCENDFAWVQNKLLDFLEHPNSDISGLAATCLGHLARKHGIVDKGHVVKRLRSHLDNGAVAGRVSDALDDIETFL